MMLSALDQHGVAGRPGTRGADAPGRQGDHTEGAAFGALVDLHLTVALQGSGPGSTPGESPKSGQAGVVGATGRLSGAEERGLAEEAAAAVEPPAVGMPGTDGERDAAGAGVLGGAVPGQVPSAHVATTAVTDRPVPAGHPAAQVADPATGTTSRTTAAGPAAGPAGATGTTPPALGPTSAAGTEAAASAGTLPGGDGAAGRPAQAVPAADARALPAPAADAACAPTGAASAGGAGAVARATANPASRQEAASQPPVDLAGSAPAPVATGAGATGAAQPPSGSPTSGADPAAVTGQVLPTVARLVTRGEGTHQVTLRLHPRDLGEVRVTLTIRDGQVDVTLAAGPEAREALRAGASQLRSMLEQAGATAGQLVVRDLAPGAHQAGTGGSGASWQTAAAGDASARHDGTSAGGGEGGAGRGGESGGRDPSGAARGSAGPRTAHDAAAPTDREPGSPATTTLDVRI